MPEKGQNTKKPSPHRREGFWSENGLFLLFAARDRDQQNEHNDATGDHKDGIEVKSAFFFDWINGGWSRSRSRHGGDCLWNSTRSWGHAGLLRISASGCDWCGCARLRLSLRVTGGRGNTGLLRVTSDRGDTGLLRVTSGRCDTRLLRIASSRGDAWLLLLLLRHRESLSHRSIGARSGTRSAGGCAGG